MVTKEDLILSTVNKVAEDMKELRTESKAQSESLLRLEVEFEGFKTVCRNTHCNVDSKIEALNSFKKEHELIKITELNAQIGRKIDWRTWGIRLIIGVPATIILTAIVAILKGCN